MNQRKQWAITLGICTALAGCGMFSTQVKPGEICEIVDFGAGNKFKVCAGTAAQLELVKQTAAARKAEPSK
jgi:hypothetical protein